jgi:5-methylcytosine-specific restriction endonuclease McrA
MRKLNIPAIDFRYAFGECVNGVGSAATQQNYMQNVTTHVQIEQQYSQLAASGDLFGLPRFQSGPGLDQVVHGQLRRSELTKLYTQYLVPKGKPARVIYEELKVTANGKCPFCGDIGHVTTLDHFLPKANFPIYSVCPNNLVPCCRDCNSEKLNSYATTKGGQTLHPYFDANHFFSTQWVTASVIPGDPPVVEFHVSPPQNWSADDQQRVTSHFDEYLLAEKFGREAAADLPETMHMRRTIMHNLSQQEFSDHLLERSANLHFPVNNWRRVMFSALGQSPWFCSQLFN